MSVQFIYFDVGGVIYNFSGGLQAMAEKHGLQYADFEKVFRKYDDQTCRGQIQPQQLWEIYQEELGFQDKDLIFLDYWVTNFTSIKETHELIRQLVEANIPVGLLTNIYSGVFEKAQSTGAIPVVEYASVVKSCEIHSVKPEKMIYEVAQQRAGVGPENILFIDDKQDYLDPAVALGWQTLLFDSKKPIESIKKIKRKLV